MAWTYHDYEEQSTDTLRLARLRQHISEVSAQIQASVKSPAGERANEVLKDYRKQLDARRIELETTVGTLSSDDVRVRAAFTRGRPL